MEFKFTTMSMVKYMLTGFVLLLVWILGGGLIGLYTRNLIYAFSYLFVIPIIYKIGRKVLFPTKLMTVLINESGIELKEKDENINWNEIHWYHYENNGNYANLQIRLNDGRNKNIFYLNRNNINEWNSFIDTFIVNVKNKCPNLRKRFSPRFWRILIGVAIIINIAIPLVMMIFKVKPIQFTATWLTLIGMSFAIIAKLRNGDDVPRRYNTYKEIQDEKKGIIARK